MGVKNKDCVCCICLAENEGPQMGSDKFMLGQIRAESQGHIKIVS